MALHQTLLAAVVLLNGAYAALDADPDIGYDLQVASVGADVPRTCFKVPGIPASVNGAFFISGPAKFEMGGYKFNSYFDGYGRINRFELGNGEACFTAKFLNTSYFNHAKALGRISNGPTFDGVEPKLPHCPLRHPMCFITGVQMDNNWVNILPTNNKKEGLMITDSPIMTRLDYETLTVTAGNYPWSDSMPHSGGMMPGFLEAGHMPATGSAHPLRRPNTNHYVEIMLEVGILPFSKDKIAVYTIDQDTMKRSLLAHVPAKQAQYLHSFGVSENYVVLPFNLKAGMPKGETLLSAFQPAWDGIHVVDLAGNVQIFDTEPFFHVHISNTFENETGIVMDLATSVDLPFNSHNLATSSFLNKTERDTKATQNVERMHLHLAGPMKGKVTREKLTPPGRFTDFLKINDMKAGLPHCIYYAVEWFHDDKIKASMAILKHDVCNNKRTYWTKEHSYPSEPFFISTGDESSAEDEGVIVFVTLDGPRGASNFVILDAKTFKEVSVVELPVHIPFLAHGQFIPKAAQEAVKANMKMEDPVLAATISSTFQI